MRPFAVISFLLVVIPQGLHAQIEAIYWTESGKINRANPDGSNIETMVRISSPDLAEMILDPEGGKIYWMDFALEISPTELNRANLDGSAVEKGIMTNLGSVRALALDKPAGKIYWASHIDPSRAGGVRKIQRANLDGSNIEDLISAGQGFFSGIALDPKAGKMYWTDIDFEIDSSSIWRANLDGSDIEELVSSGITDAPTSIELDIACGKMYWIDGSAEKIQRASLDGSDIENIKSLNNPIDFALDLGSGHMYWIDGGNVGIIQRANLDGSNVTDLLTITVNSIPTSIELLPSTTTTINRCQDHPDDFTLTQAYPNPFSTTTSIAFTLAESGVVQVKAYDVLGREITLLVDGVQPAGSHEVMWGGSHLQAGVYFIRVTTESGHDEVVTVSKIE